MRRRAPSRSEAAVSRACDGRGTLVLIQGGPGIGKSRLCSEARQLAEAGGMRVLAARGGEHEQDVAYGTARQLFERLLHDADASTRRRRLAGPARLAAAALGEQFDEAPVAPESGAPHETVKLHLTNAYRELDVTGRAQLAEALENAAR